MQLKLFWASFLALAFFILPIDASVDLLKNSGFEDGAKNNIPLHWGTEYYNCSIVPGYSGKAIKIENKAPAMSLAAQSIKITPEMKKMQISAYIKAENIIEGKENWNKMNIQLLFFDKKRGLSLPIN